VSNSSSSIGRRIVRTIFAVAIVAVGLSVPEPAAAEGEAIRVAVVSIPPFVNRSSVNTPDGFYIEIWERVAKELGRPTEYVWVEKFSELLPAIDAGKVDVAVAPLAPTATRELSYDFTSAVIRSGPALGVHSRLIEKKSLVRALLSKQIAGVLLGALVGLVIIAHVIWLIERTDADGEDRDQFRRNYPQGVWDGFWWAAVTIATVGYGDKSPRSVRGRLVGLFTIMCSLFMVSAFVSQVTAALTNRASVSRVNTLDDARRYTVGAVDGSTFKTYVESQGLKTIGFPSLVSMLDAAKAGDVDVVVTNPFALRTVAKRYDVQPVGDVLYEEFETFGLAQGSPLREQINRVLADLQSRGDVQASIDRWMKAAA
jgi:polar amino acid transport system substrate-binding protein